MCRTARPPGMENEWSPEAIHIQHPDLSLAQIHAALAYYYDHKAEFDAEIERQLRDVATLTAQAGESPVRHRLRKAGLMP